MREKDRYEITYDDQDEAKKITRKLERAGVNEDAIENIEDENKLSVDDEYTDICEAVMEKYNDLKEKREAKEEILKG
jgi:hypothetical protein